MAKTLDLFIRTSIFLLVGCYTPPITNINEPAALTLDETKINNQQALITLEQLNVDMSSSIWRQYFAQRGAESIWSTL
jgi:uncharacterized lipoprotein YajG